MPKRLINYKEISELAKQGLSCSDIANKTGFAIGSIYNFAKRHNIDLNRKSSGGHNVKDETGNKYGNLVAIKRDSSVNSNLAHWVCKCICGNTCTARGADLRQGKIKTCGCRTGIKTKRNWQGFGKISKTYWSSLVRNAKSRKIELKITPKDIENLYDKQDGKCYYTGIPISLQVSDHTASIDRINNDRGYIKGNICWAHKNINRMKSSFSKEDFILLCKQVANYDNTTDVR